MLRVSLRTAVGVSTLLGTIFAAGITNSSATTLEGFGSTTPGGAGLATVHVTTLADSGPGSLREALSAGKRTIVFDVAGDINLTTYLWVNGAFVTIDGLSAPAPGITLRHYGLVIRGTSGAHDVIVRGIRVRGTDANDGIQVAFSAYNIVIDRCSVSGAADGDIDITEHVHDVTVQYTILARPGYPYKNSLIRYHPSRISLHHNLYIAATQRNPLISIDVAPTGMPSDTTVDMRGNLVWGWGAGHGTMVRWDALVNIVDNYYGVPAGGDAGEGIIVDTATTPHVYTEGNVSHDTKVNLNKKGNWATAFPAAPITTGGACAAAADVIENAGVRPLDDVDRDFLAQVSIAPCSTPPPAPVIPPAPPVPAPTPTPTPPPPIATTGDGAVHATIASKADDAREVGRTLRTSDSYLIVGRGSLVGLRFLDVAIPRGAQITSAVLKLATVAGGTRPISVRYVGEASGDALPFASARKLSSRAKTLAHVDDAPAAWSSVVASPDLTAIVQEIVSRDDWDAGHALALYLADAGSVSSRYVGSFETAPSPKSGAVLEVTFTIP